MHFDEDVDMSIYVNDVHDCSINGQNYWTEGDVVNFTLIGHREISGLPEGMYVCMYVYVCLKDML
jgi:hypothetical protein